MPITVTITGLDHTQRYLKGLPRRVHESLAVASLEASELFEHGIRHRAPGRVGNGIHTSVSGTRRFAGPFADSRFQVKAHITSQIAQWYVGGTGEHMLPEFGGPRERWYEGKQGGRRQKFEGLVTGDSVIRQFTSHEGQPARNIIEEAALALDQPVEHLYQAAVHAAVESHG